RAELAYDVWGNVAERRDADGIDRWIFASATDLNAHEAEAVACRFELDEDGRPVAEIVTFADGPEIRVGFDDDSWFGLDEDQPRVQHYVDEECRPTGLSCSVWPAAVRYRAGRQRLEIAYPNGVREVVQFDAAGRCLGQLLATAGGAELSRRRYVYDGAGRLVGIDDSLRGGRRFVFDLADRLVAVERPGDAAGDERYAYDEAGNLSRDGEQWTFETDRLLRRPGCSYAYGACGNRVERRDSSGRTRYRYDARGRLVEVELPTGQRVEYAYDALGRRVRRRLGDLETLFLWNGDNLVAEHRSD